MDFRRYNIMMLEAQQRVDSMMQDFERQFYSRRIQNAEKRQRMLEAFQQVTAEPEPLPPVDAGMEMGMEMPMMPEFEEDTNG